MVAAVVAVMVAVMVAVVAVAVAGPVVAVMTPEVVVTSMAGPDFTSSSQFFFLRLFGKLSSAISHTTFPIFCLIIHCRAYKTGGYI